MLSGDKKVIDMFSMIIKEASRVTAEADSSAYFFKSAILDHQSFEDLISHNLFSEAQKRIPESVDYKKIFTDYVSSNKDALNLIVEDLKATYTKDPACNYYYEPIVFLKGFKALQIHRIGSWFWSRGDRFLPLLLQSIVSELYQVDIHPSVSFGTAIFIDHATNLVIGKNVSIGSGVSILHSVSILSEGDGAEGKIIIEDNVLISAGSCVIGDLVLGNNSKVGAGSFINATVLPKSTVVGVPMKSILTS